jgi:hypothetical protein
MDMLFLGSIIADLLTWALAMRLLYKTRDWRVSLLAAMAVLLAAHQWIVFDFAGKLSVTAPTALGSSELTSLALSVMVLLSVFFFGRLGPLFEKGEVTRKEADINAVVEEAAAVAALDLDRKKVDLKTILGHDLPCLPVDRIQVQQVLLNLVHNGVEATRDSKHRKLTVRTRATKDGEVEVSVSDSGRGIPTDLRSSMFDPFVTSRVGGTGMGLSVSRTIVEAHGGHIWASPRRGGGTIMHFTLGLAREIGRSTPNVRK